MTSQPDNGGTASPDRDRRMIEEARQLARSIAPRDPLPEPIGPYQILRVLGEGGMGVVYLAEQNAPIHRRVALKLVKLGMDTRQVIARFEAEREALALMNHPNVAKVLDAGATQEGRPYFVMEFVEGVPVTNYCDQERLSTKDRLVLFMQVCKAVQHAHQKGIIHRDIKPSNVLVTTVDDRPAVKVIDFGIAKAIQAPLTNQALTTEFGQLIGTPAYMSPEQANPGTLDIDTRTDVYSLGVLLYELLAGAPPFDPLELRQAALSEIQRIIREVDPPKPSTRLSALKAVSTTISEMRKTSPTALARQLRGELDWIVMKCLEKERTRRYDTVSGLLAELQRYLNNEPVLAGPPSATYRLRKFVRRNRIGVAMTTVVLLSLTAGLGTTTGMYFRSERQRLHAEEQQRRADVEAKTSGQVTSFLVGLFRTADPSVNSGEKVTARELLDKGADRIATELKDDPVVQGRLWNAIGQSYDSIGLRDRARSVYQLVLDSKALSGDQAEIAWAMVGLSVLASNEGKRDEAESAQRQALAMRRRLFGDRHPDVAHSLHLLGNTLTMQGKCVEAEKVARETVSLRKELLGAQHRDVAVSLGVLARACLCQDRFVEAERHYREALAIHRSYNQENDASVAAVLNNLSSVLGKLGRFAEAEQTLREVLPVARHVYGDEHLNVALTLQGLGGVLKDQGKFGDAESFFSEAVSMLAKLYGGESFWVANAEVGLGHALQEQGKLEEAERTLRHSIASLRQHFGATHPSIANGLNNLGIMLSAAGRNAEAAECLREAIDIRGKLGEASEDLATMKVSLAAVLMELKKADEAAVINRDVLEVRKRTLPTGHWQIADARFILAVPMLELGKFEEAESLMLEGWGEIRASSDAPPQMQKHAVERLIALYEKWNRPEKADEFRAFQIEEMAPSQDPK